MSRTAPAVFFVFLAGIFLVTILERVDPDYFWRLKHGETVVQEGRLPMRETFSFTAQGERLIASAWISEVILYEIHRVSGYLGQAVFHTILLTFTHILLYIFLTRKIGLSRFGSAVLTGLCSLNFLLISATRAQNFSFIFFILSLFAVANWEEGDEKAPYQIALLTALWANFHSGFMIANVILFLIGLGRALQDRRLTGMTFAPLLLGLLVSCLNPEGYHAFVLPTYSFMEPVIRNMIVEMQPLEMANPNMFLPYMAILFLLIYYGVKIIMARRFPWALLCLALMLQSMKALRMIPFFAIVGVITIGFLLKDEEKSKFSRWLYAGVFLFVAGMSLHYAVQCVRRIYPWSESRMLEPYPQAAVRMIQIKYPGKNIFNDFNWGGFLLYHLYPSNRIAIDSRTLPYMDFIKLAYSPVVQIVPQTKYILDLVKADLVLFPTDYKISQFMSEQKDWELVLKTPTESLFARRAPQPKAKVQK